MFADVFVVIFCCCFYAFCFCFAFPLFLSCIDIVGAYQTTNSLERRSEPNRISFIEKQRSHLIVCRVVYLIDFILLYLFINSMF